MPLNNESELISNILNKSWEELEALEHEGELLFPFTLKRRRKSGWEKIPVMLKVPREPLIRKARLEARKWAEDIGLDPNEDPELFGNMDDITLLSYCIRSPTEPFEQYEPFKDQLEQNFDRPSLDEAWATIQAYREVIDPRPNQMTEEETAAVIAIVAKSRSIAPLAGFAGEFQSNCIVSMAVQLQNLLASK